MRGFQKQSSRRGLVLGSAVAVELSDREFYHCVEIAADRGLLHKARRLAGVLRHTAAFFVQSSECVLRLGVAGFRCRGEQFTGAFEVLRKLLTLQIKKAEVVGGAGMPEFGGGVQQTRSFLKVARAGAALVAKHRKRKQCVAVAFGGGELVPLSCLRVVASDAQSLCVEFAEQRHGGGIVLLGAFGRLIERGEIMAALEGAIGDIDVGLIRVGRSVRRRHRRRCFFRRLCCRCRRYGDCDDGTESDKKTNEQAHVTGSASRRRRDASDIVSATKRGSPHITSPIAMKSAPALTRGVTLSIDAAYATHAISNTSAHQATRSSTAAKAGHLPVGSGSPNIT